MIAFLQMNFKVCLAFVLQILGRKKCYMLWNLIHLDGLHIMGTSIYGRLFSWLNSCVIF